MLQPTTSSQIDPPTAPGTSLAQSQATLLERESFSIAPEQSPRQEPHGRGGSSIASWADEARQLEGRNCGARFGGLALRCLGALGVVYGDIGTSPLYTLASIYNGESELPKEDDLVEAASCLVWSLNIMVVFKYMVCVMRADHKGEGGIFALLLNIPKPASGVLYIVAALGASMLIGDGMITPAISVLTAYEGLDQGRLEGMGFAPFIIPATIVQPCGIGKIGRAFGPITFTYFVAIAGIGINNIARHGRWDVFAAVNPWLTVKFFISSRWAGSAAFWKLGSIVLAVTGAEALFADLGHFGHKPMVISWFIVVYPSLILGYLGQAAYLIDYPGHIQQAFWDSVPDSLYIGMLILVTLATIIASQALIAGCFSLVDQAVMLNLFPRVKTVHTDSTNRGQIFIPEITVILAVGTNIMVLFFQKSSNMAGAYGIAVTSTFMMTTTLFFAVLRQAWHWSLPLSLCVTLPIFFFDVSFFVANIVKLFDGGWVPLSIGLLLTLLMLTWRWGQQQILAAAGRAQHSTTESGNPTESGETNWIVATRTRQPMQVAGIFFVDALFPESNNDHFESFHSFEDSQAKARALECLAKSTNSLPRLSVIVDVRVQHDVAFMSDSERIKVEPFLDGDDSDEGPALAGICVNVGFAEPLANLHLDALLQPEVARLVAGLPHANQVNHQVHPSGATQELPLRYFLGKFQYRASVVSSLHKRFFIRIFRMINLRCKSITTFLDLPVEKVFLIGGVVEL